jgi:hypothetical protein
MLCRTHNTMIGWLEREDLPGVLEYLYGAREAGVIADPLIRRRE